MKAHEFTTILEKISNMWTEQKNGNIIVNIIIGEMMNTDIAPNSALIKFPQSNENSNP